jgi:16S rRNA (guanine966-N2)-methyltransferase
MRVIAGRLRGRRIEAPEDGSVRPTSDRVRENLFNLLAHGRLAAEAGPLLEDAHVLDGFAGSGALGIEALSRGAADAVFLDKDLTALHCLRGNLKHLGEEARATLVQADVLHPPKRESVRGNPAPRSLVFLDPPYRSGLAGAALAALETSGWLAPAALAVIELELADKTETPPGFEIADDRRYGRTRLLFLKKVEKTS